MVNKARITELTLKFLAQELTPDEQGELDNWLNSSAVNRERFEARIREDYILKGIAIWEEAVAEKEAAKAQINWEQRKTLPLHARRWRWWAAAAVLLIAGGTTLWLGRGNKPDHPAIAVAKPANDLPPGTNKAILTLADNSTIVLDTVRNGDIAQQGASHILKRITGQLVYNVPGNAAAIGFNTVSTPLGGQYQVILPDNSKVLLNAGSSLRFPTAFAGSSREVEITGEAYFEVAKNKLKPFRVKVNDMSVTVLGTHFNIMAYPDEAAIKTTLLEGAVRINMGGQTALLSPGQQAQARKELKVISGANTEEAVAWKDGLFEFNSADIEMVMRSITRWYNVQIRYEGQMTSNRLTGKIRRDAYASDVLQILSASGYHFRIEGKTIIVLP
jgi:ferric-dicitrate binding protein FerR (iron transport regulator)